MQNRNYRECAIEHLKQGNLCKGYIDYVLDEMEKLEKIRQIVNDPIGGKHLRYTKIVEILEQE